LETTKIIDGFNLGKPAKLETIKYLVACFGKWKPPKK